MKFVFFLVCIILYYGICLSQEKKEANIGVWEEVYYHLDADTRTIQTNNGTHIIASPVPAGTINKRHLLTYSSNTGVDWTLIYDTDIYYDWRNWQFINDSTIYILAQATAMLPAVHFYSVLIKTYDSGKNWIVDSVGAYNPLTNTDNTLFNDLSFVDENIGLLGFFDNSNNQIIYTTNAGANWGLISPNIGNDYLITNFILLDKLTIMFYAINTTQQNDRERLIRLYYSNDFGESWNYFEHKQHILSRSFKVLSGGKIILSDIYDYYDTQNPELGKTSFISKSIDFGETFKKIYVKRDSNIVLKDFEFFNEDIGFAIDDNDYLYFTSNGGENWIKEIEQIDKKKPRTSIRNCTFLNSKVIVCACQAGIYKYYVNGTSVQDYFSSFIHLYPNPTRDILHIRTDELISRVELSDVIGNVVKVQTSDVFKTSDVLEFNVESLPAGMYFLKLYTASGEVLVEKVIVGF